MLMDTPPEQILRVLKNKVRRRYYARCRGLGWDTQECVDWFEEVSGEGLAAAYRDKDKWEAGKGTFLYWAYMKTCALARRELQRSEGRICAEGILVMESPDIEYRDSLGEYLLKDELKGLLDVLTPDQKLAFAFYYIGDLEVVEIAKILGCQPKTVYTLLDRGRKRAREIYVKQRDGRVVRTSQERPRRTQSRAKSEPKSGEEPPPPGLTLRGRFPRSERPSWNG